MHVIPHRSDETATRRAQPRGRMRQPTARERDLLIA
jgi:hypothetical protein